MEPIHHVSTRAVRQPATVITGASDGIGNALAEAYAADPATLVVIGRDQSKLDALAKNLRQRTGRTVHVLACDLTDPSALDRLDELLERENLSIETLINSAGIGHAGEFATVDAATIAQLIALNVSALTLLCRRALRDMCTSGKGSIINMSSLGAYAPGPYQAMYYASKAYVLSLSEALAHEVRGQGIHVLAVAPGPVRTGFHDKMGARGAWYLKLMPVPGPSTVAAYVRLAHRLGARIAIPGVLPMLLMPAMRLIPHRILLPLVGFLLRPRGP